MGWVSVMLGINKVLVTRDAVHAPVAREIRERIGRDWEIIDEVTDAYQYVTQGTAPYKAGKQTLLLTRNRGAFVKSCPGTRHYSCCDYQILHWASYCPLDCMYCILQAYFHPPLMQIFVNQDDLWSELDQRLASPSIQRIGTGEFTDSLVWEPLTDLTPQLVNRFGRQSQAVLELKTKTTNISQLAGLDHNHKTIISWSLNSETVIRTVEAGTAPLVKRLQAAQQCGEWGYPLAFHFDPLIIHENWERDYAAAIELIFKYITPEQIVWISLGSFRFMPGLKEIIQKRFPQTDIIYGEFISGMDGKMRYFKPQRIAFYQQIVNWLRHWAPTTTLYFCMEDDPVWQAVLGCTPGALGGLGRMLDRSALMHCNLEA